MSRQNAGLPASLHARNISLALGARHILVGVDLSLDPGHRIGLVGPNGVGKSTLLRVLAGRLTPDTGTVTLAPPAATVGYLDQEPERADETVLSYTERRTGVVAAHAELDAATAAMAAGSLMDVERWCTRSPLPGTAPRRPMTCDRLGSWPVFGSCDA